MGNDCALEPYAGLNASLYLSHTTTVNNLYGFESSSINDDFNHFTFGGHVGLDLSINKFVIGVCYEKDFTNYEPDYNTKWSSIDLKIGFRFE